MNDRALFGIAGIAVLLAGSVAALNPWVADGPAVLDELPTAWPTRTASRASAEALPDGRVALRVGRCEGDCRAVVERALPLEGGPWLVTGEVERGKPGALARLFVQTPRERFLGPQPPIGTGRAWAVVDRSVSGDVTVGAVVRGPWGELNVGRITVAPARRSALRIGLYGAAILAFAAGAIVAAVRVLRELGGAARIGAGVVGAGVLAGVLMPSRWLDALLLAIVPGSTRADLGGSLLRDPSAPVLVQKLAGHGGGFLLLGLLGGATGAPAGQVLARIAVFGLATEAVQVLVPGRSAQPADLAVDLAAAALGLLLVRIARAAPRALRRSAASPP